MSAFPSRVTSASSALTALLEVQHPILLAPMAGVSGGRLAAAVSRAGGLGFVGAGYGESEWLRHELAHCEGLSIGIGFITWALRTQPELLRQALDARPKAVFLSFGPIGELAQPILDAGAVLIAQVQTVHQAREAVAAGAQIIVAQGGEAGGHGGVRGTLALVPATVDAVGQVPVLAAGGIGDGRGLAAALMLGASGVVCGTAFYPAVESLAHASAKERLVGASGDDTLKSPVFDMARGLNWPGGPWSLRTLRNRFTERWSEDIPALEREINEQMRGYQQARIEGNFDIAALIAGEAADMVQSIKPASEIVQSMVDQCEALLAHAH
jgi:nitronate monooxygenase